MTSVATVSKVAGRTLQTLLRGGEYEELEDVVIAEGEQLILGMTPVFLLLASRHIRNYKTDPEVYYDTEVDPFTDGLELSAVWPICFLRISYSRVKYQLTVNFYNRIRYYEMTTTCFNGNLEETWARWVERVDYIFADPYRYIRAQFDAVCLPYPEYYLEQDSQATVGHGRD
ncbi:hypothetical protein MAR_010042, partial [Mya arenaria]